MSTKAAKVLISLPERFLQEIDRMAEQEQRSRSELIREALRRYIANSPTKLEPVS